MHGNLLALEAVRKALKKEKPDVTLICGDLVMNGPEPGVAIDALREMERDGAIIVQGNTEIIVLPRCPVSQRDIVTSKNTLKRNTCQHRLSERRISTQSVLKA